MKVLRSSALLVVSISLCTASNSNAAVKGQYIAKFYTEALGRVPDQSSWLSAINLFASSGCSTSTLRSYAAGFWNSAEFTNLGYDNTAKLLSLYRGVLNREPDQTSFNSNLAALNSGTPWSTMVNTFLNGTEFTGLVNTMCNTVNYGFGSLWPMQVPVSGTGFQGTDTQLQAQINATASGGTVWLAQRAVVLLNSPLMIKAGVTLSTTGSPDHNHYVNMARLVRGGHYSDAAVKLLGGSKLRSVWVDGMRSVIGFNAADVNVQLYGGSGTEVSSSRLGNTAGGTNLKALSSGEGYPCASNLISSNLVDAYTSSHSNNLWADGLTVVCENSTVQYNEVLDPSDVGIIVFGAYPAVQHTQVINNTILSVGNSSYGGLAFDSWHDSGITQDFSGSVISNNLLWSGPSVHFDVGLAVGTRPWYGNATNRASGGQMLNNTSGSSKINVDTGIAVSGMMNATVTGNTLDMTHLNVNTCPTVDVAAAIAAGWASGTIQGPVTNTDVSQCVFH